MRPRLEGANHEHVVAAVPGDALLRREQVGEPDEIRAGAAETRHGVGERFAGVLGQRLGRDLLHLGRTDEAVLGGVGRSLTHERTVDCLDVRHEVVHREAVVRDHVQVGAGGGEWTFACGPGEPAGGVADVVIRASVVDWCRRFADRLEPDVVPAEVEGDAELAKELVSAANAFAGL